MPLTQSWMIWVKWRPMIWVNWLLPKSLWPSDIYIRQHWSGSTLAQVGACCLMAPSHYQNQWWLPINEVPWHSYEDSFTTAASAINHKYLNFIQISQGPIELNTTKHSNAQPCIVRHRKNFLVFAGPRRDFGLILWISYMINHRSFTGPTHLLSANVWGPVSFVVSVYFWDILPWWLFRNNGW